MRLKSGFMLVSVLVVFGCTDSAQVNKKCQSNSDCASGQTCVGGTCQTTGDTGPVDVGDGGRGDVRDGGTDADSDGGDGGSAPPTTFYYFTSASGHGMSSSYTVDWSVGAPVPKGEGSSESYRVRLAPVKP